MLFYHYYSFAIAPKIKYPEKKDKKLRYQIIFLTKSDSTRSDEEQECKDAIKVFFSQFTEKLP